MAAKKRKSRRRIRRSVRRVYARAKRAVRKYTPRRRRRRAPAAIAKRRRAPARRRRNLPAMAGGRLPRLAGGIAAGVGGAVAAAAVVNAAPIADNRSKALIAAGVGVVAYMMLPKKQRLLKAAAIGATLGGALSLTKQMFPNIPMMAGAEPYRMGVNMRPTFAPATNMQARRALFDRSEAASFKNATRSGRNAAFMGNGGAGGAMFGHFQTPANL